MINFTKAEGLGNDFILIEGKELQPPLHKGMTTDLALLSQRLCHRCTGIGADGVVIIHNATDADCAIQVFNADGSVALQCGNALRCVALYICHQASIDRTMGVASDRGSNSYTIKYSNRYHRAQLNRLGEHLANVQIELGEPDISPESVLSVGAVVVAGNKCQLTLDEKTFYFTPVSMGNPHIVIEHDDLANLPIEEWGPLLEGAACFPDGVNVEFVQFSSPSSVRVRVWERGVGETQACGSGACAVLVAGVLQGKLHRQAKIEMPGGTLAIDWDPENGLIMQGEAKLIFTGKISL